MKAPSKGQRRAEEKMKEASEEDKSNKGWEWD